MARKTGAISADGGTVHPHFYERANAVENRLIKLIDGGEDLADWYPRLDLSRLIRTRQASGIGGSYDV
jgi:hypothetical protein